MPVTQEYLDFIIDQLRPFGSVTSRRMFGGAGLYHNGIFFGLIADDVLYFKVDDGNRKDYTDVGMGPFKPFGSYAMGYYEVPAEVLEDPDELALWARKAYDAAGRNNGNKTKAGKRDRR
jgi:DNA transformation protein and related proteins